MICPSGSLFESWEIITASIYGLITIILYLYLIVIIVTKAQCHHPFFYQFILLSVTNVVLWIAIFILQRIISNNLFCNFFYPYYVNGSLFTKILLYGYYIPICIQAFTIIVISISRMTVVISPLSATHFWANHVPHTIVGTLLTALVYSFHVYDWGMRIDFIIPDNLNISMIDGWPHIPLATMAAIISVICLIVIITSATVGLIILYKSNVTKRRSAEINLFWTNIGISIATVALSFYMFMVYFYYYVYPNEKIYISTVRIRGWIFDVNCLTPAWLLVVSNKQIRDCVLHRTSSALKSSK